MRVVCSDDIVSLYINKVYFQNFDFSDKCFLESYLKKILKMLSNRYNLFFDGFYDINMYTDINYGVIIDVIREDLEYFDYFNNQIQMNIKVIETSFLYELFDFPTFSIEMFDVYKFSDKIYVKIKEQMDVIMLGKLIELSRIIYGNEAQKILKLAKKVR